MLFVAQLLCLTAQLDYPCLTNKSTTISLFVAIKIDFFFGLHTFVWAQIIIFNYKSWKTNLFKYEMNFCFRKNLNLFRLTFKFLLKITNLKKVFLFIILTLFFFNHYKRLKKDLEQFIRFKPYLFQPISSKLFGITSCDWYAYYTTRPIIFIIFFDFGNYLDEKKFFEMNVIFFFAWFYGGFFKKNWELFI